MSDHYTSIVSEKINLTDSKKTAKKVILFLTDKRIIKKELSDSVISSNSYKPDKNYNSILNKVNKELLNLKTNNVEFITERSVFENGGNGLNGVHCPNCKSNEIEKNWETSLSNWLHEYKSDLLKCSKCSSEYSIVKYKFEPTWGFGNFGITFWNWGILKNDFIEEIKKVVGTDIKIINGLI